MVVAVGVSEPATVNQHGPIEKGGIAIARGLHFAHEVSKLFEVIAIDLDALLHQYRIIAMVGDGVMRFGDADFGPIFRALVDARYHGWVSVEVFDYSPDPETIARESLRYMRECAARI